MSASALGGRLRDTVGSAVGERFIDNELLHRRQLNQSVIVVLSLQYITGDLHVVGLILTQFKEARRRPSPA